MLSKYIKMNIKRSPVERKCVLSYYELNNIKKDIEPFLVRTSVAQLSAKQGS